MSFSPPSTISVQPLLASTTGVATGIDWSSIISKLMSIQQQPLTALQNQQGLLQQKDAVYGSIQGNLSSVQTAADALRQLGGNALAGSAATSSDPTVASASAKPGALLGTVSLNVLNLASAASAISSSALDKATGTAATAPSFSSAADIRANASFDPNASLSSQAGNLTGLTSAVGGTFSVNGTAIAWTGGDSLLSVLGKINSANAGVVATYDSGTGKVSLVGTSTGSGSTMTLAESGGGLLAGLGLGAGSSTGTDATSFDPTQTLASQAAYMDTPVTAGNVTLNGVTFNIDPTKQSLNDIMRAFYGSTAGVQGLYDSTDGTLSLVTKATGASAQLQLGAGGDSSNLFSALKLGVVTPGQDAQVEVNGGAKQSLASNSSSALLPGATVTLQGVGSSTINISPDATTAAADVKAMVDAYNSAVQAVSGELNQAPAPAANSAAASTATALQGAFISDPLFQRTQDTLTNVVVNTRLSGGTTRELSQIGLSLSSASPGAAQTLSFDQNAFIAAYQSDPNAVQALVAGNGTGLADNLYQAMNGLVDPATGAYTLQLNGDTSTENELAGQISDMSSRLTQQQQAMQTQYATLEATLGTMQAQANQLSATFTKLASA